jgi:hypothetical protein
VTLSPVFHSERAMALLRHEGVWDHLQGTALAERDATRRVRADLAEVLEAPFLRPIEEENGDPNHVEFVQRFFFLVFFRSVLESVVQSRALDLYSELNFCIQGTITAADNLFDHEQKSLLPVVTEGRRFGSILQLLCFERLTCRVFDRAVRDGVASSGTSNLVQRDLLSRMATIGALEGSEEGGIDEVLEVDAIIERVHRVRGGALFALGLVAPTHVEPRGHQPVIRSVERAMSRLGTAFQMVDDLTDFEFDVQHRRHNVVVSQVHHSGTRDERMALRQLRESARPIDVWPQRFLASARAVLHGAQRETRQSLEELHALGFWFPPALADALVCSIAGVDGVATMETLSR